MLSSVIATCLWNCSCASWSHLRAAGAGEVHLHRPTLARDELRLRRADRLPGEPGGPEVVARDASGRPACREARHTPCACRLHVTSWGSSGARRPRSGRTMRSRPWPPRPSTSVAVFPAAAAAHSSLAVWVWAGVVVVVVGASVVVGRGARGRGGRRAGRASGGGRGRRSSRAGCPRSARAGNAARRSGRRDARPCTGPSRRAGRRRCRCPGFEISGSSDAEAVDPVADDVDGDVERVGLVLPHRRQHDGHAAAQVEAEHRGVARRRSWRRARRARSRRDATRKMTFLRTTQRPGSSDGGSTSMASEASMASVRVGRDRHQPVGRWPVERRG